jgi:hypothetical protein
VCKGLLESRALKAFLVRKDRREAKELKDRRVLSAQRDHRGLKEFQGRR